jgi:hypothetical protein
MELVGVLLGLIFLCLVPFQLFAAVLLIIDTVYSRDGSLLWME